MEIQRKIGKLTVHFEVCHKTPHDLENETLKVDQDQTDALLKNGAISCFSYEQKGWVSVILEDMLTDTMLQAIVSESFERICVWDIAAGRMPRKGTDRTMIRNGESRSMMTGRCLNS